MAREVKWDYVHDVPVLKNGEPVLVEGIEAVKVWAWNALYTVRFRYLIYPWEYGDELETLIGQSYIEEPVHHGGAERTGQLSGGRPVDFLRDGHGLWKGGD